jgi:hypothetical protein
MKNRSPGIQSDDRRRVKKADDQCSALDSQARRFAFERFLEELFDHTIPA